MQSTLVIAQPGPIKPPSALQQLLHKQAHLIANEITDIGTQDFTLVLYLPFSSMKTGAEEMLKAASIATEEINSRGGIMNQLLHILPIDSELAQGQELTIFQELVTRFGIDAVIGPMSSQEALQLATNVTVTMGLPLLPPAANANSLSMLKDSDTVFRLAASNRQIVTRAVEFIQQVKADKVATLYRDDVFGRELAQDMSIELKQLGVEQAFSQPLSLAIGASAAEIQRAIETMLAEQVELVFLPISPEQEVEFFKLWYQTSQAPLPIILYAEHAQSMRDSRLYRADKTACVYSVVPDLGFMNIGVIEGIEKSLMTQNTSYTALYVYDLVYFSAAAFSYQQQVSSNFSTALRQISHPDGAVVDAYNWPNLARLIKRGAAIKFVGASGEALFDQHGDNQLVRLTVKSFHSFYGKGCDN